jgi:hypothetical protein
MVYLGWEYAYAIFGLILLISAVLWDKLAYNTPDDDPQMTPEEKAVRTWISFSKLSVEIAERSVGLPRDAGDRNDNGNPWELISIGLGR